MLSNFRERVDIPSQIKSILESYPFGNGLLRELLQNSDDAGATLQIFILDHRRHGTDTDFLIDPALKDTQGPALLSVNNTKFSESDWKALSTIHGSNKKTDETKIGKFGLGFRSCYHVTDNPHILSKSTLVVFDPHEEFGAGKTGGVKVNISCARETYKDQLAAFGPLLPLGATGIQGTIVRLPLRTSDQSSRSKIKQQEVRPDEIKRLFTEFIEKEMDISLLFLKHVSRIELREITAMGEVVSLASVRIENMEKIGKRRAFLRGSGATQETFRCAVVSSGQNGITSRTWRIHHSVRSATEASDLMSKRLGLQEGVRKFLEADKLFAHVALAIPLDEAIVRGRLFALLPLPIYTGFPLHVHSILALTPDRQSLRNREETGLGPESRERFAIEWNDLIFDTFVPSAWADLLGKLVSEKEITDIWSAWPSSSFQEHSSGYWNKITWNVLSEVINHDLPVCPKILNGPTIEYTSLKSLIASPSDDQDVLAALVHFGLTITQPPSHIFSLLGLLLDLSEYRWIEPKTIYEELLIHMAAAEVSPLLGQYAVTGIRFFINDDPRIVATSRSHEDTIMDFLVLSPLGDIRYLIDLPLVPLVSGKRARLYRPAMPPQRNSTHILVSSQEKELFSRDDMIALSDLSPGLQQVFRSRASAHIVNIAVLNAEYVLELFRSTPALMLAAANNNVGSAKARIPWLIKFWVWMDQWEGTQQLLPSIGQFYLLPTDSGRCERVQDHVLLPPPDSDTAHAFSRLGVSFLHADLCNSSSLLSNGIAEPPDRIAFLVDHIDSSLIGGIDTPTASTVQEYLLRSLANHKSGRLGDPQRLILLRLPIFPILVLGDNFEKQRGTGTITGKLICVNIGHYCLLPLLPYPHTYIDMSDPSHALTVLVDSDAVAHPLGEIAILELAIDHLANQPYVLLDKLVSRIISRFSDIPKASIEKLQQVAFIETRAGSRLPPKDVIDPESDLAALYEGENEKLPAHRFATRDVLPVLQHDGFFRKALSREIVLERIDYISRAGPASSKKALAFLRLLDSSWSDEFSIPDDLKWLPSTDGTLRAASDCRDKSDDVYLYDLVLGIVPYKITSLGLREALGWTTHVSFLTLALQFTNAINPPILPSDNVHRLVYLIKNTAALYDSGNISTEHLEILRTVVIQDAPWIPISRSELAPVVSRKHFVASQYAMLDGDMARKLGISFKQIASSLMTEPTLSFFIAMGCSKRPPLDALLDELGRLSSVPHSVSSVLVILEEVAHHTKKNHVNEETQARILVPDHNGMLRASKEIVYNDSNTAIFDLPEQRVPTHARISKSLASSLQLEFASSLSLGSDDDDDDEDMAEDITIRIQGILRDYDANYAINEFMANAVDAGATSFSAIFDEDSYRNSSILSKEMTMFQNGPALILHNNAEMKNADFTGLCRIGQGGKKGQYDTIGHFGLGALSLFHFTDMPMIISGDYVMFLDPTGVHLPPRKGRKRTALRRRLDSLAMRYPDQLSTLDGRCGFESSAAHYEGTLFRLPLRKRPGPLSPIVTSPSEVLNLLRTPYHDLAHDALFFTGLRYVAAEHRSERTQSRLWSVLKDLQEECCDGNFHEEDIKLTLTDARGSRCREKWMITSLISPLDSIPREHLHTVDKFQPMRTGLRTATAFRLHDTSKEKTPRLTERFLFSSMRLPVPTSLPVHIHAPFALASDRRGIRFDPPNAEGKRISDGAYNCWILTDVIPELYRYMLFRVLVFEDVNDLKGTLGPGANQWLPSSKETKDPISKEIVRAFYRTLSTSTRAIFRSVSNKLVKPEEAILCYKLPSLICTILTDLKPNELVDLPTDILNMIFREPSESASLETVTPQYLRDILVARADDFIEIWEDQSAGPSPGDIDAIITYLLNDKHLTASSLLQTPLLLDSDLSLECFGHRCPVFYLEPAQAGIASLFLATPSHFIHRSIPQKTIQLILSDKRLGLRKFDAAAAATLTREQIQTTAPHCMHPNAISQWICDWFWPSYKKLPGPPLEFRSLPLVPTNLDNEFVSLRYCDEGHVFAYPTLRPELIPIVEKLGIPVLNRNLPAALRELLGESRSSLESFLRCLSLQNTSLDGLSAGDVKKLGSWMQDQLPYIPKGQMTTLLQKNPSLKNLPIWSVRRDGKREFESLENIWMLPDGMNIEIMSRFMGAQMSIAKYNSSLQMLMQVAYPSSTGSVIFEDIINNLQWSALAQDLESFCGVLKQIFKAFPTGSLTGLRVVNGNCQLTDVHTLYDNSIPVFQSAFHRTRNTHFVHESLHSLRLQLHRAGLIHEITHHEFMNCAQAIDEDLNYLSADKVRRRAETIYSYYRNNLPAQIMTAQYLWDGLNDFRFIPRCRQRHEFADDMDRYCVQLPMIISPNEVVREEYQAISWSQRGVAIQQPPSGLQAVNPSFGVPRVADVFRHLNVLSQQVARDHGESDHARLLSDLDATYRWLDTHASEARSELLTLEGEALFLNVDEPESDAWVWKSARNLAFNLIFDAEGLSAVRTYLLPFKALLLAAGASELSEATLVNQGKMSQADSQADFLRRTFNKMREEGELTDITLKVMYPDEGPTLSEDTNLQAHASFLGANIDHVRSSLMRLREKGADLSYYDFPGTVFGACTVLDFIYKGEMKIVTPKTSDEATSLLQELRALLDVSEAWGMQELKEEVGAHIVNEGLINPETYKDVWRDAKQYNAKSLAKSCAKYEADNGDVLRKLLLPSTE